MADLSERKSGNAVPATSDQPDRPKVEVDKLQRDPTEHEIESAAQEKYEHTVNLAGRPFPLSDLHSFHQEAASIASQSLIATAGVVLVITLLVPWRHVQIVLAVLAAWTGHHAMRRSIHIRHDEFDADVERKRAQAAKDELLDRGESVEWMNSVLSDLWSSIDEEQFGLLLDMAEDIMKEISPAIVSTVRVTDLDLGTNPIRVVSMRVLPDSVPIGSEEASRGEHFNVEVHFVLRKPPDDKASSNLHMLCHLGIGHHKLGAAEIPVLATVAGLVGTIRMRIYTQGDAPFLKAATISFPELPQIAIQAKPLGLLDVMSLPPVSAFINYSIRKVLANFVHPQSYTLDLDRLLVGSSVKFQLISLGVICVQVLDAQGLRAADTDGTSDPYFTVSYARFAKPVYISRIIAGTLDPAWHETAFLRLSPDLIANGERLRITLWDSDRYTSDDTLGMVEASLKGLLENPNQMHERTDEVMPTRKIKVSGSLRWRIGFFPLVKARLPERDLEKRINELGGFAMPKRRSEEDKALKIPEEGRTRRLLEASLPPAEDRLSGILSIHLHQCADLELKGEREHLAGLAGKSSLGETTSQTPSSFAVATVNGIKLLQTRVKKLSPTPVMNDGVETFVPNWKRANLQIGVFDARVREHDALIGVVNIDLADVFQKKSQDTRWHPLSAGLGWGRIRVSLLFKPVSLRLPRQLSQSVVGTLEISEMAVEPTSKLSKPDGLKIFGTTAAFVQKLGSPQAHSDRYIWQLNEPVSIPIIARPQALTLIQLREGNKLRKTNIGLAAIWPSQLEDDREYTLKVPIHEPPTDNAAVPNETEAPTVDDKPTTTQEWQECKQLKSVKPYSELGWLHIRLRFKPGVGPHHKQLFLKHVFKVWQATAHDRNFACTEDSDSDDEPERKDTLMPPAHTASTASTLSDEPRSTSPQRASRSRGSSVSTAASAESMSWKERMAEDERFKAVRTAMWAGRNIGRKTQRLSHGIATRKTKEIEYENAGVSSI